jgi:hypothetical protein
MELSDAREAAALRILEVEGRVEKLEEKLEWSYEGACELEEQIERMDARVASTEAMRGERYELMVQLAAAKEQANAALKDLAAALELVAVCKRVKKGAHMKGASQDTKKRLSELKRNWKR